MASDASSTSNRCSSGSVSRTLQESLPAEDAWSDVLAYPNPVSQRLSIHSDELDLSTATVRVYDLLGQWHDEVYIENSGSEILLDMSSLPAAHYIVSVCRDNQVKHFRIIKD